LLNIYPKVIELHNVPNNVTIILDGSYYQNYFNKEVILPNYNFLIETFNSFIGISGNLISMEDYIFQIILSDIFSKIDYDVKNFMYDLKNFDTSLLGFNQAFINSFSFTDPNTYGKMHDISMTNQVKYKQVMESIINNGLIPCGIMIFNELRHMNALFPGIVCSLERYSNRTIYLNILSEY
jgi:hypothetical protein